MKDLFRFVTVARNGGFYPSSAGLGLSPTLYQQAYRYRLKNVSTPGFRNNKLMRLTPEGEVALGVGAMQVVEVKWMVLL